MDRLEFPDDLIEELVKAIYAGTISPLDLPEDYYEAVAEYLFRGVEKGFSDSLESLEFGSPDYELLQELQSNIYMFSAAKTFQQTMEMSEAMTDDDGQLVKWKEFRDAAYEIYTRYNGGEFEDEEYTGWLKTEYDTAITQAYNAKKWDTIEKQKETLPYLRYVVTGDENVCPICGELNGLTAPVDDPIWDETAPAQHFNCRCILEQLDEEEGGDNMWSESEIDEAVQAADAPEEFRFNPGKEREVFATTGPAQHGYFSVPKEFTTFAQSNFGLPLP